MPADHGRLAEAKALWMAQAGPVRTDCPPGRAPSGIYPTEAPPGRKPRGASPCPSVPLLQPAAEQPAKLGDHAADVLVLAGVEPAPVIGQAEVQPQMVQRCVGLAKRVQARRAALVLRLEQRFLQIEGGIDQALRDGKAESARELLGARQGPLAPWVAAAAHGHPRAAIPARFAGSVGTLSPTHDCCQGLSEPGTLAEVALDLLSLMITADICFAHFDIRFSTGPS